jgi:hypothetical protein
MSQSQTIQTTQATDYLHDIDALNSMENRYDFIMRLLRKPEYQNLDTRQLCEIALKHCPHDKLIYLFTTIYNIKRSQADRDCIWRCADNQNFSVEDLVRLFFYLYPEALKCKSISQLNKIREKSEDAAAYLSFQKKQNIGYTWWQVALAALLIIPAIYMIYANAVLYKIRTNAYYLPSPDMSNRDPDYYDTLGCNLRNTPVENLEKDLNRYRQPTEQYEHQDSL